jgi:threonine dehydrogenase-like Zn-dependent dehydrogenase
MRRFTAMVLVALLASLIWPQAPAQNSGRVRFRAVDVIIDTGGRPLAAYQFELAAEVGTIAIVGVEGGEHPAFSEPPYYDAAALQKNHIIIAAFSTQKDLPAGKTRVARVHVQVTGDTEPQYVVVLRVAASPDGTHIPATATATESRGVTQ